MENTVVKLKTIAEIEKEHLHFYVDAYQRGYRWTQEEVRDLLDDIREFSLTKNRDDNAFYCLQPIIVVKGTEENTWKVVDGQQRLTTLYLIYSYYHVISGMMGVELPYDISYNGKQRLEDCLKKFADNKYHLTSEVEDNLGEYQNDIDCYYVIKAYECICDYFGKIILNPSTRSTVNSMQDVFDNHTKIIWYEISGADLSTEVSVFSKINIGKIPLTNAELIKALLLKNDDTDSDSLTSVQANIAVKWDEIEAQLSDDRFFSFLVNEKKDDFSYTTRIDFIFRVMARVLNNNELKSATLKYPDEERYDVSEEANREKFSFYALSNYVRLLQKHPEEYEERNKHYIELIWDQVNEYYRMFKDWYKDIHWYHMVGFLVEVSNQKYIDLIIELTNLYIDKAQDGNGKKDQFEEGLLLRIKKELYGTEQFSYNDLKDFILRLEFPKDSDDIRKVLLLYNIAYLEQCKEIGRFPFDKFKSRLTGWDIEHINAVASTRPDDDRRDSEDNARLLWLERAKEIPEIEKITTSSGEPVQGRIDKIINNRTYLSKYQEGTKDFIDVYEAVINYFGDSNEPDNSIGNLTLLDEGTNRSYKNDVFPLKRKIIIDNTMRNTFIPLCTVRVFMKGFAEAKNLLKWDSKDRETYINDIVKSLAEYLKLENANE